LCLPLSVQLRIDELITTELIECSEYHIELDDLDAELLEVGLIDLLGRLTQEQQPPLEDGEALLQELRLHGLRVRGLVELEYVLVLHMGR
jgi:hypothetical protein